MTTARKRLLAGGHYAQKQLFCKDPLIAWSHRSRFQFGRQLVAPYAGRSLLDYGCGDGTFLAMVHDLFPDAVGADVDPGQTEDCARRHGERQGLSFVLTDDLADERHSGTYGVVVCMEVLEHCLDDKRQTVLADMRRLLTDDGILVVSVPIEIGPSLIVKQLGRRLAGWRGLGDYQKSERYRPGEFWKMVFACQRTRIERPVQRADFSPDRPNFYHGHKGFNWRAFQAELKHFVIVRQYFTPLGWLGGCLNSQAWFVCKLRRNPL